MKKLILFLILSTAILPAQTKAPRIFAKETNFDFGTVVEGQTVTHNYEIQNTGDANLVITDVQATCGCTAAAPEKKNLAPGEKTTIKVEFNSENRLGPQEKFVYISSNDPINPQYKLSFICVVVDKKSAEKNNKTPKLKISLLKHNFGNVEEGKIVTATINFKNVGTGQLTITDVKSSCGCTAALLSNKVLEPNQSGSIRIELDTSNREGKMTRTVTLYSNDPAAPNQSITLFVNILKRKS